MRNEVLKLSENMIDPATLVFNKLYLFNILNRDKDYITNDYHTAIQNSPNLTNLIDKLTPSEIDLLTTKIENIL